MKQIRLLLGINIFWLALSMLSDGMNALILPGYALDHLDSSYRATGLGLITFVGLIVGMAFQPIAGMVSDRLRYRFRRWHFVGTGTLMILISLSFFTIANSIVTVLLAFIVVQLAINLAQAAQQGLIPDLVPVKSRGTAAGVKGFMDIGGAMLAFIVLTPLLADNRLNMGLLVVGIFLVLTLGLTRLLVKERAISTDVLSHRVGLRDAFQISFREHPIFARLVLSRFLFLLSTYVVGRFLLLFIAERLHLDTEEATEQAGGLLAALTALTVLFTIPAGWAADTYGRKPLMLLGAIISALGVFMLGMAVESWQILIFGGLMAIGSAAFASANWALTVDVIPGEEAARFMAIANYGTAGAAAVAGLFGPIIDAGNLFSGGGYTVVFTVAALIFGLSAVSLKGVETTKAFKTVDHDYHPMTNRP